MEEKNLQANKRDGEDEPDKPVEKEKGDEQDTNLNPMNK